MARHAIVRTLAEVCETYDMMRALTLNVLDALMLLISWTLNVIKVLDSLNVLNDQDVRCHPLHG